MGRHTLATRTRCTRRATRRHFRTVSLPFVLLALSLVFFFFQAEDGIRDESVTGVQTCALPIYDTAYERECDWSSDVCSSDRSEEHTSELQSHSHLVCRLL